MRVESVDPVTSGTGVLLQFGVLGVLALAALWFFWRAWRREADRADRAEAALAALNKEIRDQVVPAVTRTTEIAAEYVSHLRAEPRRRSG